MPKPKQETAAPDKQLAATPSESPRRKTSAPEATPKTTPARKPRNAATKAAQAEPKASVKAVNAPAKKQAASKNKAQTTPAQAEATPARKGRKTPAPEPEVPATVSPEASASKRASKGKKSQPQANLAVPPMAEPEPAAEPIQAPVQAASTEPAGPQRPKRGRKTGQQTPEAAPARVEEAQAPAVSAMPEIPVVEEQTAPQAAEPAVQAEPKRSRRGRKLQATVEPAADQTVTEQPSIEEIVARALAGLNAGAAGQPVTKPTPEAQPEPVQLKAKRGRQPKQATVEAADLAPTPVSEPDQPTEPEPGRPKRGKRGVGAQPAAEVAVAEPIEATQPDTRSNRKQKRDQKVAAEGPTPIMTDQGARELVLAQLAKLGRPVHVRDFERTFTRRDREGLGERRDLGELLENLVRSGDVVRTRKRTYGLPEAMNLVRGRFQASASGFGFVVPDAGGADYYIPADLTLEAWNGDTVLVREEGGPPRRGDRGDSKRASVVRIVTRAAQQLVGTLEHNKGYAILKADDSRARHRVLLLPEGTESVPGGARVVAMLYWPETTGEDEVYGRVTRVLGEQDDPETETQAVVVKYGLRDVFSPEVLAEAEAIPVRIPERDLVGRLDLREYHIFTVDGRDAKDFDDAIHIQPTPEGTFVVGVHIADVSHYVREGTPLDAEARARATSVYLPGQVLPMLPEHLSNGVCSLVPGEDRLTLSALIEVNADGDVLNVQLAPSVIHSQARLTYDEVQAYSEGVATLPDHARKVEGDLHLLLKLTTRMRQKRLRAGSLDFKLREVKVDVDKEGNLQLIPIREETARGMIEDLMLLANQVVARHMLDKNAPALYRVHEEPTQGRFAEVSAALARMGIVLGNEPTPQAYQEALKRVRGTPQESSVNTLLLRSLKQARYSGENLGHFGLAFEEYLHFTSPIRRYPDLIVHRALRATLSGETRSRAMQELQAELPALGDHTSERERSATEAERDLTKYYQAKWAQAHLGESFEGRVTGVVASGLFVALDNGVEGKLHISNLDDDYYVFIEDAMMLRGRSGGVSYRLGDAVHITISQVNPLARQIDFTQESVMDNSAKGRARRREEKEQEQARRQRQIMPAGGEPGRQEPSRQPEAQVASRPAVNGERNAPRGGRPAQAQPQNRDRAPVRVQDGRGGEGGGQKRRVITLERPRNEHLRPVNVTVQRMYFGDWSVENMPPDEPQGGGNYGGGGRRPDSFRPRQGGGSGGRSFDRPRSAQPAQARPQPQTQQAAPAGDDAGNRKRRRRRGRRSNGGSGGQ